MRKYFLLSLFVTILSFAAQAQSPATYWKAWGKNQTNQTILRSANGNYKLIYQGDGNLCLYNKANAPIWATMTNGKPSTQFELRADGNLVIFNDRTPIWAANCADKGGSYVVLQDDGNLCVYTQDNKPIWASMTNGK